MRRSRPSGRRTQWFVCMRRLIPRTRDSALDAGKASGRAGVADIKGYVGASREG